MRHCPRCTYPLTPYRRGTVGLDHCHRCGGSFLDAGAATATFGPVAEPSYWKNSFASEHVGTSRLQCPRTGHALEVYQVAYDGREVEVDTCPQCGGMWLDRDEGRFLHDLVYRAESDSYRRQEGIDKPGIMSYLFQLLTGFPLEVWNPVRRKPLVVYSLVAILAVLFFVQLAIPPKVMEATYANFMLVPTELMQGNKLWTLVTHGFFHGGIAHILGNLYFLYIFGDNVEDALGRPQFIALYMVAMIAGGGLHFVFNTGESTPMLGASGAIAGLMGAYLALFPKVKMWVVFLFIRFRIGVIWYLGIWVGLQFLIAATGTSNVAWLAHLGGFAAGLLWGLAIRQSIQGRLTAERAV